jgi:cytochrome c biogenesis protein CcmG, thiol:disulfide interchange protein DsbE
MTGGRLKFLAPLLIVAVLVAIFGKRLMDVGQGYDPRILPSVLLDTPVPDMALEGLPGRAGGEARNGLSDEDLKGRVSLVNIWGSWCGTCVVEHPMLEQIAKSGIVKIEGIAWRDTPEASLAWLRRYGDPFNRIGQDPRSHVAIALGVTAAPETFLVDRDGIIRYKHSGAITPEVWEQSLKPLIAQLSK